MLDRGELTEAHKALSKWYGDPSLTPTDTERVDTLLSQLAGTVVYSTEHRLAPAHVVKQGETLETIAKECNVPWQLLAKINNISAVDQVRPGQELKVVKGPFQAVVDLGRKQLTLLVDDRYAGKFPVIINPEQTISDGEWVVGKKSNEQAPGRALLLQGNATTPGTPAPTLVIASDTIAVNSADGTVIKIAAKDAEELSDILSIGSRVVTRR
jgi:LysM repeat protein